MSFMFLIILSIGWIATGKNSLLRFPIVVSAYPAKTYARGGGPLRVRNTRNSLPRIGLGDFENYLGFWELLLDALGVVCYRITAQIGEGIHPPIELVEPFNIEDGSGGLLVGLLLFGDLKLHWTSPTLYGETW